MCLEHGSFCQAHVKIGMDMGRKPAIKELPLLVERILLEYTDEDKDHSLSVTEIRKKLMEVYGVDVVDDSVRGALDALEKYYARDELAVPYELQVETLPTREKDSRDSHELREETPGGDSRDTASVKVAPNKKKLYYIGSRYIERSTLEHVVGLVRQSPLAEDSKAVVDELLAMRSCYERKALKPEDTPSEGAAESRGRKLESVLYDTGEIEKVIRHNNEDEGQKKQVLDFKYMVWKEQEENGQKTYKEVAELRENMVPYLVSRDEGYLYLYCRQLRTTLNRFSLIRIEKISELVVKELEDGRNWPKNYEKWREEAKKQAMTAINRMPSSNIVRVTLKCHDKATEKYVYDNFGRNPGFERDPSSDGVYHFDVSFDGMKIWVLKHVQHYEVIDPPELREAIINELKENCYGLKLVEEKPPSAKEGSKA